MISHFFTAPWAAPSQGRSLVVCQFDVIEVEALGFYWRLRRGWLASFLGKEVAAKQTEVSDWVHRRRIPLLRPSGPVPSVPFS